MGTRVRVLSLIALLGLTGCHVYADATRGLARAVNPAISEAETRTAQYRSQHPSPGKDCLCAEPVPSR